MGRRFTETLMEVVRDDTAYPEIIWTFFTEQPLVSDRLSSSLAPGIDRGRVNLYAGVDCHQLSRTFMMFGPKSSTQNPVLAS